jgi:hypothetical protein
VYLIVDEKFTIAAKKILTSPDALSERQGIPVDVRSAVKRASAG